MTEERAYDFHGLLGLRTYRERGKWDDIFKDWNAHFLFFRKEPGKAGAGEKLDLHIGPFAPDLGGCSVIDGKYHVKPGYLFFSDRFRGHTFQIEIAGLEDEETIVRIAGNFFGLSSLLSPNVAVNDLFLMPLLERKLARTGACISHSCALSRNDRAILFSGRGGSRKTTITMSLARRGCKILGDDFVLLKPGPTVLPFPTHPSVLAYRLSGLRDESMSLWDKFQVTRATPTLPHGTSGHSGPWDFLGGPVAPKAVVLLAPHNSEDHSLQEVGADEGLAFLANNNLLEHMHGPLHLGLLAYSLCFPAGLTAHFEKTMVDNLARCLPGGKLRYFRCRFPADAPDPLVFAELGNLVGELL